MSVKTISPPLSHRLKHETEALHLQMHDLMEQAAPFSDHAHYAGYLAAQYVFQRDVQELLKHPDIQQRVTDANSRGRAHDALLDLQDLGLPIPQTPLATTQVTMPEALGWVYVSEGSTLGAAFLLKEAQSRLNLSTEHGARHLRAYDIGRAKAWRQFVAALDDDAIPPEQHDAVIEGAKDAFRRFGRLLREFGKFETVTT